jgi:hypothetical protein
MKKLQFALLAIFIGFLIATSGNLNATVFDGTGGWVEESTSTSTTKNVIIGTPLSSTSDSWCYQVTYDSGTSSDSSDDVVVGSLCFQLSSTSPLTGVWTLRRVNSGTMVNQTTLP